MGGTILGFLWLLIKIILLIALLVGLIFMAPKLFKGSAKLGTLFGKKFDRKAEEKLEQENKIQEHRVQQGIPPNNQNGGLKW